MCLGVVLDEVIVIIVTGVEDCIILLIASEYICHSRMHKASTG